MDVEANVYSANNGNIIIVVISMSFFYDDNNISQKYISNIGIIILLSFLL